MSMEPGAEVVFGEPLPPINPPASVRQYRGAPEMTIDPTRLYQATISGPAGVVVVKLVPEWAPATVNNFVTLARNLYFTGLRWGRDPQTPPGGPVIQGGSPTDGMSGGPGFSFADERVVSPMYSQGSYQPGAVAMANAGPDTNGSQFFICLAPFRLPPSYNLFGEVVSVLEVAQRVRRGDPMEVIVREQLL